MKRTAQVIDRFQSRGKLVLTLWDLSARRRFTIRLRADAEVDLGEVLRIGEEVPKVRRVFSDAIDRRWQEAAVLPIFGRDRQGDTERETREQGYGTSAA